ncbi:hypothetical protein GWI33_002885 [Rhynchophorus ferrugineus]|uniref:Uncharacterized protein n=1 Tax=Rhynchophorus ferrugineus TaxID=354439 RepID=A0A834MFC3_RHYFE|nr:hypothetical protein GWI33_002885 [Rhynchophorus ferrugineus]
MRFEPGARSAFALLTMDDDDDGSVACLPACRPRLSDPPPDAGGSTTTTTFCLSELMEMGTGMCRGVIIVRKVGFTALIGPGTIQTSTVFDLELFENTLTHTRTQTRGCTMDGEMELIGKDRS